MLEFVFVFVFVFWFVFWFGLIWFPSLLVRLGLLFVEFWFGFLFDVRSYLPTYFPTNHAGETPLPARVDLPIIPQVLYL